MQPLRLEIKKEITARSDRVKSVDMHPTETLVKSFELCEVPVRCAKFIVRKQYFIAATDDMHLRVFNYNTMEKVKAWEAHTDYIRFIEVHPNRPVILSSSDDMSIKMWDWERDFDCVQIFEGHGHYVMMVKINPRDTNTFASASLDRSVKVWGLTAGTPHFSLEGHDKGVNCVDYYPGGDKPYLLSGADDRAVKIWDYQTKACLQTLEGHSHNISAVCFHPRLPLIVSASEDGTVRLWHSTTYRPETTLNYGMERVWTLCPTKDANKLAIGYDEGTIVIKLGNEKPVASLDINAGKLVWAKGHDIQTMSIKSTPGKQDIPVDGEKVSLAPRDLGACEVYPQLLMHNRNGQFIVVLGDGEYIIYTSQALRNKGFGTALDFVWSSQGTGDYAVRESISRVKIFKNFKEHKILNLSSTSAEGIYGGTCLCVRSSDSILFYDWDEGEFLRKIDVTARNIYWNDNGDMLVVACEDQYFILKYDAELVATAMSTNSIDKENGVEGAFELEYSMTDKIRTGQWVGDCFLFTNGTGRLNYFVGGQVMTLCHMDHPMYLLGFVPKEDRVFLIDKAYNVISHKALLSVLNYQTAVVRKDFDTANTILPSIPKSEYSAVAKFLESQGFKEEALIVSPDLDHRFELALDLKKLSIAHQVLLESDKLESYDADSTDTQSKWKRLGDLALSQGIIELAQMCAERSNDLSGLLLLYSASGNKDGMMKLASKAKDAGRSNVSFIAYFVTGHVEECIQLLIDTNRIPEAAFMARTYMPSMITSVLDLWKNDLKKVNEKAADALADPLRYSNLFPDLNWAIEVEKIFKSGRHNFVAASMYPSAKDDLTLDLISIIKQQFEAGLLNQNNDSTNESKSQSNSAPSSPAKVASYSSPSPTSSPVKVAVASNPNVVEDEEVLEVHESKDVSATNDDVNQEEEEEGDGDGGDINLDNEENEVYEQTEDQNRDSDHDELDELVNQADQLITSSPQKTDPTSQTVSKDDDKDELEMDEDEDW